MFPLYFGMNVLDSWVSFPGWDHHIKTCFGAYPPSHLIDTGGSVCRAKVTGLHISI